MNMTLNFESIRRGLNALVNDVGSTRFIAPDTNETSITELIGLRTYEPSTRPYASVGMRGFMLELTPLTGLDSTHERHLLSLIEGLELKDWSLQFVLFASPHIGDVLDSYRAQRARKASTPLLSLAQARADSFEACAFAPLAVGQNWRARRVRIIMSLTSPSASDEALILARQNVHQIFDAVICKII